MKAISLWQPWASAMAIGAKQIETRGWSTNYRGPVAIHAAKRLKKREMFDLANSLPFCAVFQHELMPSFWCQKLCEILPFGAIVAIGDLIACDAVEQLDLSFLKNRKWRNDEGSVVNESPDPRGLFYASWSEYELGDYSPGRFAWWFNKIKKLKNPIPFKGSQGWFNVPDELIAEQL